MARPQRIDDHSFWAGKGPEGQPLPLEAKMKSYNSADGAGSLSSYEDSENAIQNMQERGISKAKKYAQPTGDRN